MNKKDDPHSKSTPDSTIDVAILIFSPVYIAYIGSDINS